MFEDCDLGHLGLHPRERPATRQSELLEFADTSRGVRGVSSSMDCKQQIMAHRREDNSGDQGNAEGRKMRF